MDIATLNFIAYLLFLLVCVLLAWIMPPLLHPHTRREHPWVAVRGGRDLNGGDVEDAPHPVPDDEPFRAWWLHRLRRSRPAPQD